MSLSPEKIIALRKVLRTGILDKTLDDLRKAAATGDTVSQTDFLKIMYGQTVHTYNTYAGTMLTQLATLSYLQANPKERQLNEKNILEKEFTVFSKDTLMARRLLLSRVKVPDITSSASIEAMLSFGGEQQAEEAERDKKEILRLRGELELSKIAMQRAIDRGTAENVKNESNMAAMLDEMRNIVSMLNKKSTSSKVVGESKGLEGGEAPEGTGGDAVLNKSITMIEQGGEAIDWK
jgi:hypothetical protein